ncbi:hypothetical protein ABW20_dc0101600 [Dactylellina cionopaga]|nr:hypothetical protein ABW20_dc0101600 [Dactylellina cionopaga]
MSILDGLYSLYDQRGGKKIEDVLPFSKASSFIVAIINDTLIFTSGSYLFNRDIRPASDPKLHKINTTNVNDRGRRVSVVQPNQWILCYGTGWRGFHGGGQGIRTWGRNPGMIIFEGNTTPPRWNFIRESNDPEGIPTPGTLGGSAVYIPVGEKEALVLLGGYDVGFQTTLFVFDGLTVSQTTQQGVMFAKESGLDWGLRPLTDILVYDIATNIWNIITAVGMIPTSRSEFFLVVNSVPDNSYHNIIFYGGWSQFLGAAFADVWVPSLPSFRWIKIDDENNPDTRTSKNNLDNPVIDNVGRTRHKCNVYKNTQMIATGGIVSQYYDIKMNIDACKSISIRIGSIKYTSLLNI